MLEYGLETFDITRQKEIQNSTIGGKSVVDQFWNAQEPVLEHFQKWDTTADSAHYSELFWDRLKPTVRTKCRGLLLKIVAVMHDNAHLHTAAHTVCRLLQLNFEVFGHLLCSPDHASSDCHLFGLFKDILRGC
jgi:hypothetical protein